MSEIMYKSFTFTGSPGQHFTETINVPGKIEGCRIAKHTYQGSGNVTFRIDPYDTKIIVHCTFWGFGGGTASVLVEVVYGAYDAVREPEPGVTTRVVDLDFSGVSGETLEKTYEDPSGAIRSFEILGSTGGNSESLEVEITKSGRLVVKVKLAGDPGEKVKLTLFILVTVSS